MFSLAVSKRMSGPHRSCSTPMIFGCRISLAYSACCEMRRLDAPHARVVRRVAVLQVVDVVMRGQPARAFDKLIGHRAQALDFRSRSGRRATTMAPTSLYSSICDLVSMVPSTVRRSLTPRVRVVERRGRRAMPRPDGKAAGFYHGGRTRARSASVLKACFAASITVVARFAPPALA